MAWSVTELGADILLFEQLLDFALCNHIIQIAECCKFEAAGIELETVKTQIRSNEILYLSEENSLLKSTNQLLMGRVAIIQQLLHQHYGVKFPQAETCSILRYQPGQYYKRHIDNLLLSSRLEKVAQGVPTREKVKGKREKDKSSKYKLTILPLCSPAPLPLCLPAPLLSS